MRDKQLLKECLNFVKNLNIILESVSDQVLAFVYKNYQKLSELISILEDEAVFPSMGMEVPNRENQYYHQRIGHYEN